MDPDKTPALIKIKSRAERDFAELSEYQLNTIKALLRTFMKKMQQIYDSATEKLDACHPHRAKSCSTCAFVDKSDWPGFVQTAYALCHSILEQSSRKGHFLCHANQPKMLTERLLDPTKLTACRGYVSVLALYPTRISEVARLTMEAIEKVKTGPRDPDPTHQQGTPTS
jgi:hypothetical protein